MAESNSYLIEVDEHEYDLEAIGDEIVVSDFAKTEGKMIKALLEPSAKSFHDLVRPTDPLFSFPATAELWTLIFAANDWFDIHGEEANEWMDKRITELATPHIRAWRASTTNENQT